jgi:IS30 family transposase
MKIRENRWLSPNERSELWTRWLKGESYVEVAAALGIRPSSVNVELFSCSGFRPRNNRSRRVLSELEREEISRCLAVKLSVRAIARKLGRSPSTISREIRRNGGGTRYRARRAERRAWKCARRPKVCKLATCRRLARVVATKLRRLWSPEQTADWLRRTFVGQPSMNVSHETIYRSLFLQARGALKAELRTYLRTGRMRRRPHRDTKANTASIVDGVSISERPAEVADRAVPGHWEGDLLFGDVHSYIATLVERHTRYCMLVKVPSKNGVVPAIQKQIARLPAHLFKSLTWDRGSEMSAHKAFTVETNIPVYFADPRSPWQRGSNENTNGLLRQYFPRGKNVSHFTQASLDRVAHSLNSRPRKTLGFRTPAEVFNQLLP